MKRKNMLYNIFQSIYLKTYKKDLSDIREQGIK